ncbi:MAG: acyl carrier protein [Neolewinella sp.]|jgi:acyl carrier protein
MTTTISNYIVKEFHGDNPTLTIAPEDDLLAGNLLGSMDMMRLIAFLEDEFEFKVAPMDMTIDNFITIQAMANYIEGVKA